MPALGRQKGRDLQESDAGPCAGEFTLSIKSRKGKGWHKGTHPFLRSVYLPTAPFRKDGEAFRFQGMCHVIQPTIHPKHVWAASCVSETVLNLVWDVQTEEAGCSETENTSDDEGQGEEDSPSMCNKANDPPLIVFRASNSQVHPRNLSPIHHHQAQRG